VQVCRDSVLSRFFAVSNRSGKSDTADISFKMLQAYAANDTTRLLELDAYLREQQTDRRNWDLWPSDIPLPALDSMQASTAFRFIFAAYGTRIYEAITVTQTDTAHWLHYCSYSRDRESHQFHIHKDFKRRISEQAWQTIVSKLLYADFWGLKSEDYHRGDDGSDLTVMGYQQLPGSVRSHLVHRWTPTALNEAFYYAYNELLRKEDRLY
jgi:hypothetical protein